jgi:hypothetical protein
MGPSHQALAARIRHAASQLLACADQLASDELMVPGSTGQRRPHPLLKAAHELRLLQELEGVTPRIEGGAPLFAIGADLRDEPAAAVACAAGCGASFTLTPRTPAAVCGCGTVHWGELFYDASQRREVLNIVSYESM